MSIQVCLWVFCVVFIVNAVANLFIKFYKLKHPEIYDKKTDNNSSEPSVDDTESKED